MLTYLSSQARRSLRPSVRQKIKSVLDPLLLPIGSIKGAKLSTSNIALTFDDGPDPSVTPRLIWLLRSRNVKATFFVLTHKASQQQELMEMIVAEGHEVGLHFDKHDRLTQLPFMVVRDRLRVARLQLEDLVGPVRLFRPPFGAQNLATFFLARAEGLEVVIWGPYAEDWEEQTSESAAGKVLGPLRGGDIVLLHDGLEKPAGHPMPTFDRVRMVEIILDGLEQRGMAAGTVGALIATAGIKRSTWFRA